MAHLVQTAQFYQDLQSGTLPQVCWLVPVAADSEHPPANVQTGMWYVTNLINAVMQSQTTCSTVLISTRNLRRRMSFQRAQHWTLAISKPRCPEIYDTFASRKKVRPCKIGVLKGAGSFVVSLKWKPTLSLRNQT